MKMPWWLDGKWSICISFVFVFVTLAAIISLTFLSTYVIQKMAIEDSMIYSRILTEFRTLYASEVIAKLKDSNINVSHDYHAKENSIPLPITLSLKLGSVIAKNSQQIQVKLYSPFPFPWRKEESGLQDSFAKEAWEFLKENPSKPFHRIEHYNGKKVLRYASADVMRESCLHCHNTHASSPKRDWKSGDVRGILEIIRPLDKMERSVLPWVLGVAVLFFLVITGNFLILGLLKKRLQMALDLLKQKESTRD